MAEQRVRPPNFLSAARAAYPCVMEPPADGSTYLRIRFSKLDTARYLSHHNLMSVWERALRRAGVPVSFSGGYSPRPVMRFGPPIPVGYAAVESGGDP